MLARRFGPVKERGRTTPEIPMQATFVVNAVASVRRSQKGGLKNEG
jgi:hypothetical protein